MTDPPRRFEPELSHRDQRAVRDVDRSFGTLAGIVVVLIAVALEVPLPLVGFTCLLALAVVGAAYLGWADRLLAGYASDLHARRAGGTGTERLRSAEAGPARSSSRGGLEDGGVPGSRAGTDQL